MTEKVTEPDGKDCGDASGMYRLIYVIEESLAV
jgi:hypothetical protein